MSDRKPEASLLFREVKTERERRSLRGECLPRGCHSPPSPLPRVSKRKVGIRARTLPHSPGRERYIVEILQFESVVFELREIGP